LSDSPDIGYRCGNSASILEVGPGGSMYFNVFEAAPENDRDGPSQQAAQNANGKVWVCQNCPTDFGIEPLFLATRILFIVLRRLLITALADI
jgi:hypothetical protein